MLDFWKTKKLAEIFFLNPEFWNQLSQKSPTFSCSPFRAKISTFSPALPTIWPAENNLLPRLLMAGKSKLLWSSSLSVSTGERRDHWSQRSRLNWLESKREGNRHHHLFSIRICKEQMRRRGFLDGWQWTTLEGESSDGKIIVTETPS